VPPEGAWCAACHGQRWWAERHAPTSLGKKSDMICTSHARVLPWRPAAAAGVDQGVQVRIALMAARPAGQQDAHVAGAKRAPWRRQLMAIVAHCCARWSGPGGAATVRRSSRDETGQQGPREGGAWDGAKAHWADPFR